MARHVRIDSYCFEKDYYARGIERELRKSRAREDNDGDQRCGDVLHGDCLGGKRGSKRDETASTSNETSLGRRLETTAVLYSAVFSDADRVTLSVTCHFRETSISHAPPLVLWPDSRRLSRHSGSDRPRRSLGGAIYSSRRSNNIILLRVVHVRTKSILTILTSYLFSWQTIVKQYVLHKSMGHPSIRPFQSFPYHITRNVVSKP